MKIKKYLLAFAEIILFLSGLTGLKAQTVTDIREMNCSLIINKIRKDYNWMINKYY